jgi:hypothetical protein
MKHLLVGAFALSLAPFLATAGTICPGIGGGTGTTPYPPDNSATGCNTVFTIDPTGAVSVAVRDSNPYDGSDDTLVGVVNNSPNTITQLSLSGSDIFGFDGDGICTFAFAGNSYCSTSALNGTDPQDYQGPTSTFTITNSNSGTVNFSPGVAPGSSTYFSLEEAPTASVAGSVTGSTPGGSTPSGPVSNTPEPGTVAMMLSGLSAVTFGVRRKKI